ncbi:MAG: matrixin family metalloprotease [Pyrinomonadaceae bacterium]
MYTLNRTLKLGDSGPAVFALHGFLSELGYLQPNILHAHLPITQLAEFDEVRAYLSSLPKPASPGKYDEETAKAVRSFQKNYNLPGDGTLDEVTLEEMRRPRCRVPDVPGVTFFPSFRDADIRSNPVCAWDSRELSWHVAEAPNVDPATFKAAFVEMVNKWAQLARLTLREGGIGSNLQAFKYSGDGSGGVYAYAYFPCSGRVSGDQYYDANDAWSLANATPANKADLKTILLHELGHALGLGHTGVAAAVMYPTLAFGDQKREPTADDRTGITQLYG